MSVSVMTKVARLGMVTFGLTAAYAAIAQSGGAHAGHAAAAPAAGAPAAAAAPTPATQTPPGVATPTAGAAADPAAVIDKGRELFANWSCGSCHTLADGGGQGHIGPSLDGNQNLTEQFVVDRVTNGQGAMPAFGGQMTDEEIKTIASYITQMAQK